MGGQIPLFGRGSEREHVRSASTARSRRRPRDALTRIQSPGARPRGDHAPPPLRATAATTRALGGEPGRARARRRSPPRSCPRPPGPPRRAARLAPERAVQRLGVRAELEHVAQDRERARPPPRRPPRRPRRAPRSSRRGWRCSSRRGSCARPRRQRAERCGGSVDRLERRAPRRPARRRRRAPPRAPRRRCGRCARPPSGSRTTTGVPRTA